MRDLLLAIDQGTTGTKAIVVDRKRGLTAESYRKHRQIVPRPGWLEHDAEEIWEMVRQAVADCLATGNIRPERIASVGLSNQGETVLFWDGRGGRPLSPAVVWSCRRAASEAERWKAEGGWADKVRRKTGLEIDAYYSAAKIRWLMNESEPVRDGIRSGTALCGTLDAWLIWNMTGSRSFVTDTSTAARTQLFNIRNLTYDSDILRHLGIGRAWLPRVLDSIDDFGTTDPDAFCGIRAPIRVSLVDQPAALFGQNGNEPGSVNCTYGTGCFLYAHAGERLPAAIPEAVATTVAWTTKAVRAYAFEGAVLSAGSALDWAREQAGLFADYDELQRWSVEAFDTLAKEEDTPFDGVMFIPALNGLGTPYGNDAVRAVFAGLHALADRKRMMLAVLEGIAHRVADVLEAMEQHAVPDISQLNACGGLSVNPYLMQYQAELLQRPVDVPDRKQLSVWGVAGMLGADTGWWPFGEPEPDRKFRTYAPVRNPTFAAVRRAGWKRFLNHSEFMNFT